MELAAAHSKSWHFPTLAGALKAIAEARREDTANLDNNRRHTQRVETLYGHFFINLTEAGKSPLKASLAKLKLTFGRCFYILAAPFHQTDA